MSSKIGRCLNCCCFQCKHECDLDSQKQLMLWPLSIPQKGSDVYTDMNNHLGNSAELL